MAWHGRRWDTSNLVRGYTDTLPFTNRVRVRGAVHAKDQSPVHHILRIFDLYVLCLLRLGCLYTFACRSYEYGPCVGVTRMERWERAAALGLNPPVEESPAIFLDDPVLHIT